MTGGIRIDCDNLELAGFGKLHERFVKDVPEYAGQVSFDGCVLVMTDTGVQAWVRWMDRDRVLPGSDGGGAKQFLKWMARRLHAQAEAVRAKERREREHKLATVASYGGWL